MLPAIVNINCSVVGGAALVARAGGIEAVVATLNLHPIDEGLQKQGCFALATFADNGFMKLHPRAAGQGGRNRGRRRCHACSSNNVSVQYFACFILLDVAGDEFSDSDLRAARMGAIEMVAAAMKAHPHEANFMIQYLVCLI